MAVNTHQDVVRIRSDKTAFNTGTPVWVTTENQTSPLFWPVNTTFRIRSVISNTGTTNTSLSGWNIAFSRNGGAFTLVTLTGTIVKMDPTASTDAGSITLTNHLLSGGSGTAANGMGVDDLNITAPDRLLGSTHAEFEFGMSIPSGVVAAGDTLDFHTFFNSVTLNSYTFTPRVIVAGVSPAAGAAQGDANAAATGIAAKRSQGAAQGDAVATGQISAGKSTVGAAQGDSVASAHGTGFSLGAGAAQGDADAAAVGTITLPIPLVGFAQGDAVALAIGTRIAAASGLAQGDATALGIAEGGMEGIAVGDATASGAGFYRLSRAWHTQTRIGQRAPKARTEISQ